MNTLKINNLRKEYDSFVLDNVSFEIPKGYIMGFIGENGAGKTTTLKAMLNVINKDSGSVEIFGKNIDEHEIEIKKDIGFVSGDAFYPKSKITDITSVYRRFYKEWDQERYESLLTLFSLNPLKRLDELSKGMKIKLSIALSLSHNAKLIVLDEPTSGLDPVARDGLLEIFQELVEDEEVSILFSTHITSDLEKCADYITFIQNGKIIESCTKDDLIDNYKLVTGSKSDLESIKEQMIAYKTNAFGFTGLIHSNTEIDSSNIRIANPSLDDIMIYYAERGAL